MRISDWSSDVCSSDLGGGIRTHTREPSGDFKSPASTIPPHPPVAALLAVRQGAGNGMARIGMPDTGNHSSLRRRRISFPALKKGTCLEGTSTIEIGRAHV